jgi:integrase
MAEGIEIRHRTDCASFDGARCRCSPTFRAVVWSQADGRKVSRTFPTLAAARQWRGDMQGLARRGVRVAGSSVTLRAAGADLLDGMASGRVRGRAGDVYKPSVVRGYEQALRLHVLPTLGARPLSKIERRDVQRLVDEMLARRADPSTVRNALKPLQVICRRALDDGDLAINPCDRIRLPAVRGRRDRIASPCEARALLEALSLDRALWGMAFYAGVRMGELRALEWADVRLDDGVIRIERALDGRGAVIPPKSRAGYRGIPIIQPLRQLIAAHPPIDARSGLVFGRDDGRPFAPNVVNRRAKTAWARAGLTSIGLHEARHTYASLLIAAGVNAKAISTYMGHSSVQVTFDRYGHLMPGSEAEAAALLEAYLERADTASRLEQLALEG